MYPTDDMLREAREGVALAGWEPSNSKTSPFRPRSQRGADGSVTVCQHCRADTNPARWPLFFLEGPHAGQLLWTCTTCKKAQADRRSVAAVLVQVHPEP